MKFIKFTMSTKETFTLPMEQAQAILNDPANVVMISENGEWNGETINKSFLISTKRDLDKEREYKMYDAKIALIEEHKPNAQEIKDLLGKHKPDFIKNIER
jgi:hypothetical protein